MIRVIEFDGLNPAPAYTDFSAVYVSTRLAAEQRRTALRHERAHIWLQHQLRRDAFARQMDEPMDRKAWNIATDLEIAKHIYTKRDDDAITEPRSTLNGGIRLCHCDEFPGAEYAEDFYLAIMASAPPDGASSMDGDASDAAAEDGWNHGVCQSGDIGDLVADAKSRSDDASSADDHQASTMQAQRSIANFKPPKPSLSSLIDMHIGRAVRSRANSYRRPSRRRVASDLIAKGAATKQKTPRMTVYVDRSGSFSPEKTSASLKALTSCLMKYRGRVDCDVIYFADSLMSTDPGRGCGGTNYQPVVDQIVADRAEIAIIVTDADSAEGVTVRGALSPVVVVPIDCQVTDIGRILRAEHANETA